jgi:hypothetical protein
MADVTIELEVERCPDGVQVLPAPEPDGPTVFRYRSLRRETRRFELADLAAPVIVDFVNATTDELKREFLDRYGIPDHFDRSDKSVLIHRSLLEKWQKEYGTILDLETDQSLPGRGAMDLINAEMSQYPVRLETRLVGPKGTPRPILTVKHVLGFMLYEATMIHAQGAKKATCEWCGTTFLTGGTTGRRSTARFCSEKHRLAAMRARKASASEG